MANVEIPPAWGRISKAKRQADGKYKATGRFKTPNVRVLQRNRYGSASRKAEDALLKLFKDLASEDVQPLGSEDPFGKIIEEWIIHAEFDKARFRDRRPRRH